MIEDINSEGLLYDDGDVAPILGKIPPGRGKRSIFVPHLVTLETEYP